MIQDPAINGASQTGDRDRSILGLSTSQLAGLSVEELVGNKTAVTMLMHYYKQLSEENGSLRNDLNTLQTYVDGYRSAKQDARIGAVLLALSNIGVGFGVNLLTNKSYAPGLVTFLPGICLLGAGLYFSLRNNG